MKIFLKITLVIISILISYVVMIIIKNPEIDYKMIVAHYFSKIGSWYMGLGSSSFNRERSDYIVTYFYPPSTKGKFVNGVIIDDIVFPSTYKANSDSDNKPIKAVVFAPESYTNKKLPIIINIHAGGWVIQGTGERLIDYAKNETIVFDVHYRLAPEHKFPTAVEDAFAALEYLSKTDHFILKTGDFNDISIIGESAGGNIAAALCIMARDRNSTIKIKRQILIYPSLNVNFTMDSHTIYKDGFILNHENGNWFARQYITNETDLHNNPYLNPTLNRNFQGIPSTFIILAKHDLIYSEGIYYYELLKKGDVPVKLKVYNNVHGFYGFIKSKGEDHDAYLLIMEFIKDEIKF